MSELSPIVVFDLDGTLADTAPDLIATLNRIMEREGLPHVDLSDARDLIGAGSRAMISKGFEAAGKELVPDKLDELFRVFLAIYAQNLCVSTTLFPHAVAAMDALAEQGFALAVCTNKVEHHSVELLQALGVAERFRAVCGRDTFPWFKPDPRHLTLTIEKAGGDPGRAVMVGDSRTDIETAKAAGIPVVAVTFGYTDTPVLELGPDIVIETFEDLIPAVGRLVPQRLSAA